MQQETRNLLIKVAVAAGVVFVASLLLILLASLLTSGRVDSGVLP